MTKTGTKKALRAFHGDPEVAATYLARVLHHYDADRIVQGIGAKGSGDSFRGCAVGCTLNVYDHSRYPAEIGWPIELAYLVDAIHEGLPREEAVRWPALALAYPHDGADLTGVASQFIVWLLTKECPSESGARVAALFRRRLAGDEPKKEEFEEARAAARAAYGARAADAAAYAADAAAYAAYADAAAANAAADAAAYAARAAAGGAARAAAHDDYRAWLRMRNKLLSLLRDAPYKEARGG